jgi:hypothetical protein
MKSAVRLAGALLYLMHQTSRRIRSGKYLDTEAEGVMCVTAGGACPLQRQASAASLQSMVEIH